MSLNKGILDPNGTGNINGANNANGENKGFNSVDLEEIIKESKKLGFETIALNIEQAIGSKNKSNVLSVRLTLEEQIRIANRYTQTGIERLIKETVKIQATYQKWHEREYRPLCAQISTETKILRRNATASLSEWVSVSGLSPMVLSFVSQLRVIGKSDISLKLACQQLLEALQAVANQEASNIIKWHEDEIKKQMALIFGKLEQTVAQQYTEVVSLQRVGNGALLQIDGSLLKLLEVKVTLSTFDKYRWCLYGGLAASMMVSIMTGFLPGFITWFLTMPAMISGAVAGKNLWWVSKQNQAEKELQSLSAECLRRIQYKAVQRLNSDADIFEREIQSRLENILWSKQDEKDVNIEKVEEKKAELRRRNDAITVKIQQVLKKLSAAGVNGKEVSVQRENGKVTLTPQLTLDI